MMSRPTLLVYTGGQTGLTGEICTKALQRGWVPFCPETGHAFELNRRDSVSGSELIPIMVSLMNLADGLLLPTLCTEPDTVSTTTVLELEGGYRIVPVYRYRNGDDIPRAPETQTRHTALETLGQAMRLNGRKREILLEIVRQGGPTQKELAETTGIPASTVRASVRTLETEHLIFQTACTCSTQPRMTKRRIFLTCHGEEVAALLRGGSL